jgi:hypothetical protein
MKQPRIFILLIAILCLVSVVSAADVRYEYYDSQVNSKSFYDVTWSAQTFRIGTVGENKSFFLSNISLYLNKTGSPAGNFTVGLRAVNSSGDPTGADLVNYSVNATSISGAKWYNFSMTSTALDKGGKYAIVFRLAGGDGSNKIVAYGNFASAYAGGNDYDSGNSGSTWSINTARDISFQVFGLNETCNFTYNGVTTPASCDGFPTFNTLNNTIYNYTTVGNTLYLNYTSSAIDYSYPITASSNMNLTYYYSNTTGVYPIFVNWSYKVFENSRTYNANVYSTSQEVISANITIGVPYSSVSANLFYNGTPYSSTVTVNGSEVILYNLLSIPFTNTTINNSFYWNVTIDAVSIITNTSNQTVSPISFGLCGGAYATPFINFTSRSAANPFPVVNATFKATWSLSALEGGTTASYSYEDLNENRTSWTFCSQFNETIYADAEIEFDGTGYALNFHYLTNATLTNATEQISLYLLNDTDASATVILVLDDAKEPIADVIIYIQLYDIGTGNFYTIGMGKTDFKGEDVTYLNWINSLYRFILIKDGEIIKSTNNTRVYSTPVQMNIGEDYTFSSDKFRDFEYSLYYNNATNNFVLTYTKPSGLVELGCLRVVRRTAENDTTVCTSCESSTSATLSCNIAAYGNGTYIATFYATGSYQSIDWITETVGASFAEEIYNALGKDDATFYAFLFSGIVVAMMFIHPVFAVLGIILGILGGAALGFQVINYAESIGIILVGGVIIWFIKR